VLLGGRGQTKISLGRGIGNKGGPPNTQQQKKHKRLGLKAGQGRGPKKEKTHNKQTPTKQKTKKKKNRKKKQHVFLG